MSLMSPSQDVVGGDCKEEGIQERIDVNIIQRNEFHVSHCDVIALFAFKVLPSHMLEEFEGLGDSSLQPIDCFLSVIPRLVLDTTQTDSKKLGSFGQGLDFLP